MTENGHSDLNSAPRGPADAPPEVAAIEADIERTREDLAQTVDALAAKLDVKTRVRHRVAETKADVVQRARIVRAGVTDDRGQPTPTILAVGGGVVAAAAAVVLVALWRNGNKPRRLRRRHLRRRRRW